MSLMRFGVAIIVVSSLHSAGIGHAAEIPGNDAWRQSGRTEHGAAAAVGSGAAAGDGPNGVTFQAKTACEWRKAVVDSPEVVGSVGVQFSGIITPGEVFSPTDGDVGIVVCDNGHMELKQFDAGEPAVSARELARFARADLVLDLPEARSMPPEGRVWTVGVPGWFWIDPAHWRPVSVSASIPELSITLTAVPLYAVWDPGDGTAPVRCDGPGTVFAPGPGGAAVPSPTCGHTYLRRPAPGSAMRADGERFTLRATITWDLGWSASNGESGSLGTLERTSSQSVAVRQIQAVGVNP